MRVVDFMADMKNNDSMPRIKTRRSHDYNFMVATNRINFSIYEVYYFNELRYTYTYTYMYLEREKKTHRYPKIVMTHI